MLVSRQAGFVLENLALRQQLAALIRDNDSFYGLEFSERVEGMGVKETKTAYRSPWQNPFCERIIGSIRRDCLDHVIIFTESHLRRILNSYFEYYHLSPTPNASVTGARLPGTKGDGSFSPLDTGRLPPQCVGDIRAWQRARGASTAQIQRPPHPFRLGTTSYRGEPPR